MNTKEALYNFCLRFGDNNIILGQRLAEWCSKGPILEEDLAITNISLDLFGQSENIFEYAAELEGKGRSPDNLAFLRDERHYYNNLLIEQPNGDFAFTMVRQFLFSAFAKHLYEALCSLKDEKLSALAAKALKEIKYHLRHSSEWVIRFGKGTEESHQRVQYALNELWMFTEDLFLMNEADKKLIQEGISVNLDNLYSKWENTVDEIIREAELKVPENTSMITGGINGTHTEHLGHILCEMQYLQRAYPEAKW